MVVTLQISNTSGADLGPFSLTANVGSVVPSTATRAQLIAGLNVTVDNAATTITLTSTGNCTNGTTVNISGIPPAGCTIWDVLVVQQDLDDATGNTDAGKNNNTLYATYVACDNTLTTGQFGVAGTYQVCVKEFSSPSPIVFTYVNNNEFAPIHGSAITDTFAPCTGPITTTTTTTTTTIAPSTTTTTTTTIAPSTTTTTTTTLPPTTTTTTTTTTIAPTTCTLWDVAITQGDIDDATGNVLDPSRNGTVYVEFIACDGTPTTIAYGGVLTTQKCVSMLGSPAPTIYIYQNDIQLGVAQGSYISDTFIPCT